MGANDYPHWFTLRAAVGETGRPALRVTQVRAEADLDDDGGAATAGYQLASLLQSLSLGADFAPYPADTLIHALGCLSGRGRQHFDPDTYPEEAAAQAAVFAAAYRWNKMVAHRRSRPAAE